VVSDCYPCNSFKGSKASLNESVPLEKTASVRSNRSMVQWFKKLGGRENSSSSSLRYSSRGKTNETK
jgi:hypothetical protein